MLPLVRRAVLTKIHFFLGCYPADVSSSNWNGQIFSKWATSWAFELQGCWAWLTSSDLCGDCAALDCGSEYLIVRHTTKLKLIDLKTTHRLCKLGHSTQIFTLGETSGFDGSLSGYHIFLFSPNLCLFLIEAESGNFLVCIASVYSQIYNTTFSTRSEYTPAQNRHC